MLPHNALTTKLRVQNDHNSEFFKGKLLAQVFLAEKTMNNMTKNNYSPSR